MHLPYSDRLQIDQIKITGYLLSETNSRGKAAFFRSLGFRSEAWQVLAQALADIARGNPITGSVVSPYGTRYLVEGELETPAGKQPLPRVQTVWIIESGSDRPRLITAYPARGQTHDP